MTDGDGDPTPPAKSNSEGSASTEADSSSKPAKKSGFLGLPDYLDLPARIVGGVAALLTIASFTDIGQRVIAAETGRIFGQVGFVYYEVDSDGAPTKFGELSLLKSTPSTVDHIEYGNKLRAQSTKNMWTAPSIDKAQSRVIFRIDGGKCVVVLAPVNDKRFKDDKKADWFKVATSSCGLFN